MTMFELTAVLWRRRGLVVLVAAAVFAIGTIAVLAARTLTYTASSEVLFDQPGLMVTEGGAAVPSKINNLLPTFCRLAAGNEVAAAAASSAGVSVAETSSVGCSPEPSTLIIHLQYTNHSAAQAQKVVTGVAQALVTAVQRRYDQGSTPGPLRLTAQVIEASHASRDSNGTVRSLGLVALAAIVIASAFALAAEPHRRDWSMPTPNEEQLLAARIPRD